MKFTRRNRGLFSTSRLSGQSPRPPRARRPTLGLEHCEERTLLSIALVSSPSAGSGSTNGNADFSATSLDGEDFYYSQTQSNPGSLSANGTKLVFIGDSNGVANSVNASKQASEAFVHDTTTGQTTLVSVTPDGEPGNGDSFDPVISPNGRYVAFLSVATNLSASSQTPFGGWTVVPNPPAVADLYVRDLQTQTTTLLDQTPTGQASDGFSAGQFVFSPNSSTIAWIDTSDNLTAATVDPLSRPTNAGELPTYVYTRDLATQTTSLASVSTGDQASGNFSSGYETDLVFSPDSRSLVFGSSATDLTNNLIKTSSNRAITLGESTPENLFLRNLAAGTTTLLSVTKGGLLDVNGTSSGAVFSPDGKSVAFTSDVTDLTANGTDFTPPTSTAARLSSPSLVPSNIFIRDLGAATTTLVTATPSGLQSNGLALSPVFSPDGSKVAFTSSATDLTSNPLDPTTTPGSPMPGVANPFGYISNNVFLRDTLAGTTKLISVTPEGTLSSGSANQIVFSPDGQLLAYTTSAGDLTNNTFAAAPTASAGTPSNPTIAVPVEVKAVNLANNPFETTPTASFGTPSDFMNIGRFEINNVFVCNLDTGATSLASATTDDRLSDANATGLIFSPDSGSLFYTSNATNLTSNPPDTSRANPATTSPNGTNLFAYDFSTGTTSLISATAAGRLSDSSSISALLSPDGQTLYFDSDAADMTSGNSNPDRSTEIYAASAPFTAANQFQFRSWQSSAKESDGSVVVTVLRTGPSTTAASVDYSIMDGTAKAGTDFKATSGALTFALGQTSATFTVPLIPTDRFSDMRSAVLLLSNPQGASLGYSSAALDLTSERAPASPTVTATTPTPTPTPTSTSISAINPGPTVVSVVPMNSRGGTNKLVITFDQALDPRSAANVANYGVTIPGTRHALVKHRGAASSRRSIGIRTATYDAAHHQITLTLRTRLRQKQSIQLEIKGTTGGVANTQGISLNSPDLPKQGQNYLAALSVSTRR